MKRNLQAVYIEATRLGPFRFRSGDIGVVLDLMIHDIDIIRMIAKSPVERVDAVGINLLGAYEDMANARLSFQCGCVANVTASRASLKPLRQIRIFTPECYVSLDYGSSKCKIFHKPPQAELEKLNLQKSVPKTFFGLSFEEIFFSRILKIEELSMKSYEPLYAELESFVRCIQENVSPIVSGEDGLEAIRIARAITDDIQRNLDRVKQRFAGQNV
jgi:predicted dehydrogenase